MSPRVDRCGGRAGPVGGAVAVVPVAAVPAAGSGGWAAGEPGAEVEDGSEV